MIGGEQQQQSGASGAQMSLEQKLDLLESRFTQPTVPTNENSDRNFLSLQTPSWGNQDNLITKQPLATTPQAYNMNTNSAPVTGRSSPHHHHSRNNSEHSFQFSRSLSNHSPQNSNPIPQSSVRSRRRLSLQSTSFQTVAMAAARHMRKVAASSPVQGSSTNPQQNFQPNPQLDGSRSCSSSSNATMITSNKNHQTTSSNHQMSHQHPVEQRVVAESPPVIVSPHNNATPVRKPNKPTVVRNLMMNEPTRTSPRKKKPRTENDSASESNILTRSKSTTSAPPSPTKSTTSSSSSTKRKSAPKRKVPSIKDATAASAINTTTPDSAKRPKQEETDATAATAADMTSNTNTSNLSSKSPFRSALTELSRDKSNLSTRSTKKEPTTQAPANNRKIQDFFTVATNKSKDKDASASSNNANAGNQTAAAVAGKKKGKATSSLPSQRVTRSQNIDWEAKCQKLELLLDEKDQQLKAVTNNRTIIHTSLKAELDKKGKELESLKNAHSSKISHVTKELEQLLRWQSSQQQKELKEKLAADGARLGRIVVSKVGMRALESWEEGYATHDLEDRKAKLLERQQLLQARYHEVMRKDLSSSLEQMEARESVQRHIYNCEVELKELAQEEMALNDEKAAHIRALKRVASEDASRFRSKPKLHDRYVLHSLLGKGGFSEVWKGYDLVELREVAVKIHQLDPRWPDSKKENYTKHVSREYEIHRSVRHPRIVSLFDVFEIDNNSFATVLECCKGTDLDTLLKTKKRLPERQARAILLQILRGMRYLSEPGDNRQGIIHYDLKPGNILFDEMGDAKITDFGLSKIIDTADPGESMELTSQGAGTYWYLPPECFITNEKVRISNKVDVWSIGVIYYQMLYGVRPFGEGKSQDHLLRENTMLNADQVTFSERVTVSKAGKAFIRQCLQYDQAFRPTIAQLCENQYVLEESF